ncbi:MAG: UDP-N-acetylmuramate dehydrogenase [Elusimicrobiota bacterium]
MLNHSEILKAVNLSCSSSCKTGRQIGWKVLQNEPMGKHTTFHIGGPCDFYIEVKTITELKQLVKLCFTEKIPYQIIGFGSNILVKDGGIRGIVIKLVDDFYSFNFKGNCIIAVGGGCALQLFAKKCVDNDLSGTELFIGIPGTIGGALIMNAGIKEGNIGSLVKSVTTIDEKGEIRKIEKKSLKFFYRSSNIPQKSIIISAEFLLSEKALLKKNGKNSTIKNSNRLMQYRTETQPVGSYNAGCIFKNPQGDYAARLIDEAGMKGASIGGAVVSKIHANFINNTGTATAEDVLSLIEKIQKKVEEKFNKKLELEIKVIGEERKIVDDKTIKG